MKKLILSLLCIGSILALPGCWCCRRDCEEPCEEYCDDYDDCYDENDADGREIIGHEEQQGWEKPIYAKGKGRGEDRKVVGYEEQQGYKMPMYRKKSSGTARPVMHEPVYPAVMEKAHEQGKLAEYCNPDHARHGKKMYKQERMHSEKAPKRTSRAKEMMEAGAMD